MNVLCRTKVIPEPFDHAVLSRRLPEKKRKGKVFFCGLLLHCELSSQVAFTSLC